MSELSLEILEKILKTFPEKDLEYLLVQYQWEEFNCGEKHKEKIEIIKKILECKQPC